MSRLRLEFVGILAVLLAFAAGSAYASDSTTESATTKVANQYSVDCTAYPVPGSNPPQHSRTPNGQTGVTIRDTGTINDPNGVVYQCWSGNWNPVTRWKQPEVQPQPQPAPGDRWWWTPCTRCQWVAAPTQKATRTTYRRR